MGGTNSILQHSLQNVTYVPPDLMTLNNNNHNMTSSSKRKNSKSRRHNLVMYSSSSLSPRNTAAGGQIPLSSTLSAPSSNDENEQQQLIHEILLSKPHIITPRHSSSPSAPPTTPPSSSPFSSSALAPVPAPNPAPSSPLPQKNMNNLRLLLTKVIQNNFFYFNNLSSLQLEMLLTVIQRKEYSYQDIIFREGDSGSTLYIIESGEVEVLIHQNQVRTLQTGQIFGEIGLLFNCNRTATIRCLSPSCSLYLIHRKFYKNIQKLTNTASILQRNRWLLSCPELSTNFTPIHMSRLFSTLKHITFQKDEILYEEGKETNYVLLIERGRAMVTSYPSELSRLLSREVEEEKGEEREEREEEQRERKSNGHRIEDLVGILRPKNWKNIDSQSPSEFLNTFYHRAASTVISEDETEESGWKCLTSTSTGTGDNGLLAEIEAAKEADKGAKLLSSYLTRQESVPVPTELNSVEFEVLHEGCIIGLPLLHASAKKSDEKSWKYVQSPVILPRHTPIVRRSSTLQSSSFTDSSLNSPRGGESKIGGGGNGALAPPRREGYVLSPVTVVALTDLQCSIFTISAFERAFGPLSASSSSHPINRPSFAQPSQLLPFRPTQLQSIPSEAQLQSSCSSKESPMLGSSYSGSVYGFSTKAGPSHPFTDLNSFHYLKILGVGGFGTVLLATYNPSSLSPSPSPSPNYAVKIMSKEWVAQKGQVKHVLDESKILQSFSCPFILHLYGTFQTKNWIAMVTDVCELGDLWSVIYETEVFQENDTLPLDLVQFYLTGIVCGLDHMHNRQVIFRDLKPENILIDQRGYIKLIDCGLAKKLPYEELDFLTDEMTVIYKAHSMCGTPEYLAPEFFSSHGVDRAVDIWALGILLYEMFMFRTPFATDETINNVEALFLSIAAVQETAIFDDEMIDEKSNTPLAAMLIHELLRAEPTSRIGYEETIAILQHPFFNRVHIASILDQSALPPFIPLDPSEAGSGLSQREINSPLTSDEITKLLQYKPYQGQNSVWKEFGPMYR